MVEWWAASVSCSLTMWIRIQMHTHVHEQIKNKVKILIHVYSNNWKHISPYSECWNNAIVNRLPYICACRLIEWSCYSVWGQHQEVQRKVWHQSSLDLLGQCSIHSYSDKHWVGTEVTIHMGWETDRLSYWRSNPNDSLIDNLNLEITYLLNLHVLISKAQMLMDTR